jgi:hypothetical protein
LKRQLQARTRELGEARKHLAEALEQQTATSEVLQVISSSPGELEPVFLAMLENATRICEATFGNLLLSAGSAFRVAAMHGAPRAWDELRRRDPVIRVGPKSPLARIAATRQLEHIADIRTEEARSQVAPSHDLSTADTRSASQDADCRSVSGLAGYLILS